jgi:alkylation response protein AidB-like acyl-CoA dehydrogenase
MALRKELRQYYVDLFTPELRAALDAEFEEMGGPVFREVVGYMGRDGWLGLGWPKEYGGKGLSALEQYIFWDETYRARAPLPVISVNTIGPTIMQYGTQAQKDELLPAILRGEMFFGVGYTEPAAGTDLASLTTTAVRDGDEYVINGQKVFTSLASDADYCWLATRTDPDASKHAGLSMFVVDMKTPGVKAEPMDLLSDHNICTTFLDDVRVPAGNLVGGENKGWGLITSQLNHERVTICSPGILDKCLQGTRKWAQEKRLPDGRRVIDQEWVQTNLARVYAGLEFLKLINWKVAWCATQDRLDVADASTTKVFGTEWYMESFRLLMEVLGQRGYLKRGSPEAEVNGHLETLYRGLLILTFGGGTNEIQRDLIGMFGLGLPRAPRF